MFAVSFSPDMIIHYSSLMIGDWSIPILNSTDSRHENRNRPPNVVFSIPIPRRRNDDIANCLSCDLFTHVTSGGSKISIQHRRLNRYWVLSLFICFLLEKI